MWMKIWATVGFLGILTLNTYLSFIGVSEGMRNNIIISVILISIIAYTLYGFSKSKRLRVNILNDLPNTFRLTLSFIGGYIITMSLNVDKIFIGLALYICSLFLNDEELRKLYRKLFPKGGFSLALLGIDGSGKSTHARELVKWLMSEGYRVKLVEFSRYLFVDKLALKLRGQRITKETISGEYMPRLNILRMIRPWLSLLDNMLYLLLSYIDVLRGYIVIYDRYIWSTFIKYEALGYPVKPIKRIVMLIKPSYGILLDIPVHVSIKRINERRYHLPYPSHVLMRERLEYLKLAMSLKYPIINTYVNSRNKVQYSIRRIVKNLINLKS